MAGMLNQWSSIGAWSAGWPVLRASSMRSSPRGHASLLVWLSWRRRRNSHWLSKVITCNTPRPWFSPGSFHCCNEFVPGRDSVDCICKKYVFFYFQLSSVWKLLLYLTGSVLTCFCSFAFQLSFSFRISPCLTRSYSSLRSFCDRAHPQTWNCTFWTRDVCSKAYSLAFYKDLNNLQNLDPAAVSNECSQDCIRELKYTIVAVLLQHYVFVSAQSKK